jgi:uncharacterized short protein YbdD (DUF466 family)
MSPAAGTTTALGDDSSAPLSNGASGPPWTPPARGSSRTPQAALVAILRQARLAMRALLRIAGAPDYETYVAMASRAGAPRSLMSRGELYERTCRSKAAKLGCC